MGESNPTPNQNKKNNQPLELHLILQIFLHVLVYRICFVNKNKCVFFAFELRLCDYHR